MPRKVQKIDPNASPAEISKETVDRAIPVAGKTIFIWDKIVKGFGLVVQPTGFKSYVFQYRNANNKPRRMKIGGAGYIDAEGKTVGADMSAVEARSKAEDHRYTVKHGDDPLEEKRSIRDAIDVNTMLDLYLASSKFAEKADSTRSVDQGRVKRHIRPLLGRKIVNKLTPEDIRRAFAAIRDGKTAANEKTGSRGRAIVKGGAGTARMAIRLFRAIMQWAISEGMAASNPADHVSVGSDGKRDVILEDVDAYSRLFRTLDDLQNKRIIRPSHADAIRVIALTGARKGEITELRWSNVDLKKGLITLAPTQHKTGRKTGDVRKIGLPAAAQAIIANQPQREPEDFVFVPAKGESAVCIAKAWRKIRDAAHLPDDLVLHGLRHSLGSHMAMDGAAAAEIMTTLGHKQLSTTQRYIHFAQDARSNLAERAAGIVNAGIAISKNGESESNVAPITQGGKK